MLLFLRLLSNLLFIKVFNLEADNFQADVIIYKPYKKTSLALINYHLENCKIQHLISWENIFNSLKLRKLALPLKIHPKGSKFNYFILLIKIQK